MIDELLYIYPDLDVEVTVIVQDDGNGNGPVIVQWNDPRPQPTQAELDAAELPAAQQAKILQLKSSCKNAIESGFTSSALGSVHTYDSALPQDQTNLLGAVMAGIDLMYTCIDSNNVKQQKLHTAAQMQTLYADAMTHVQAAKGRFYARKAEVEAATTLSAVDGVVW